MFFVYRHLRLDTGQPFYVGKGKTNANRFTHISRYYRAFNPFGRNKHWHSIVKKHGYEVEIIFTHHDENVIFEKEKEFIKLYGRRDLNTGTLVNLTNGGEGENGRIFSKEHCRKISESKKGIPTNISDETRLRLSKLMSGKNNYFYGVKMNGIDNPFYGKKHTEDFIENNLRGKNNPMYGMTGELNPFYGKTHTKEFLRHKQILHSNKVLVINNGKKIFFDCVRDCADYFNCTTKNILFRDKQRLKGKIAKFGIFKGVHLEILK